jgi:hypothetical protein
LGEGDRLEVDYEAGGAYATIEGRGELSAALDGEAGETIEVDGAALYKLSAHPRHQSHRLALAWAAGELRIWSLSFAAAVP